MSRPGIGGHYLAVQRGAYEPIQALARQTKRQPLRPPVKPPVKPDASPQEAA